MIIKLNAQETVDLLTWALCELSVLPAGRVVDRIKIANNECTITLKDTEEAAE